VAGNFHERFEREELPLPSDRSSGLVFTCVALVVAYLWRANGTAMWAAIAIAAGLLGISLLTPGFLRPLNIAWMRFAALLSRVMNPIVMLVLFAIAIVPAGLLMQLMRDPLRKRRNGNEMTYWIEREQSERSSMINQF